MGRKKKIDQEIYGKTSDEKFKTRKEISENKPKSLGLFDHIKHIRTIQDPDYYNNLNDEDRKSFNHFMILRALSMNPALTDDISVLFRYFDKMPSNRFYTLLISLIPADKRFYPWVKSQKKVNKVVVEFISQKFEVSPREAEEYLYILSNTESGQKELFKICQGFGLTEKEVNKLLLEKE